MSEPTIRPARAEDWPAIAALLEAADLSLDGARDHLGDFVVAEGDGALLATAGLEIYGSDALLRSVAVHPTARGGGLGSRIVDAALATARARGIDTIALLTTTAGGYFPRFGFQPVSMSEIPGPVRRSSQFNGACPASAVAMCCRLAPNSEPCGEHP